MIGRDLRGPVELVIPRPDQGALGVEKSQYARELKERLESIHGKVRDQLNLGGLNVKSRYDKRADPVGFQPGEAGGLYNPRGKKGRTPKLVRPWEGPYRVVQRLTDVVYRIRLSPRTKVRTVNRFRLFKCTEAAAEGAESASHLEEDEGGEHLPDFVPESLPAPTPIHLSATSPEFVPASAT